MSSRRESHRQASRDFWEILTRESKESSSSVDFWKVVLQLIEQSQSLLSRVNSESVERSARLTLSNRLLSFFESSLNSLAVDSPSPATLHAINNCLTLFLSLSFGSSLVYNAEGVKVFAHLTSIFLAMKKFLDVSGFSLPAEIFATHAEGIDQTIEKVFETNHPYERGKVIHFE